MPKINGLFRGIAACFTLALSVSAHAANLYLTPEVGYLGGYNRGSGDSNETTLRLGGKDRDWTPGVGLALGIGVPLDELVPFDVGLPSWLDLRFELEAISTTDDFEYRGVGNTTQAPVLISLDTVSTTFGLWFDVPVMGGVDAVIGQRVPFFDPIIFTFGGGPGFARHDLAFRNSGESRKNEVLAFSWQAGAGFGYRLTEHVTLLANYRYSELGEISAKGCCVSPVAGEFFDLTTSQHNVLVGARVVFFGVPAPHRWYRRW